MYHAVTGSVGSLISQFENFSIHQALRILNFKLVKFLSPGTKTVIAECLKSNVLVSELLMFFKMFCKTGVENQEQFFGGSNYFSITRVFLVLKPHNIIFVQTNLLTEHNRTQSILDCVRLRAAEPKWAQSSSGLSSIWLDLFDWVWLVRKLNLHKFGVRSIWFDCRTLSNWIEFDWFWPGSTEFDIP